MELIFTIFSAGFYILLTFIFTLLGPLLLLSFFIVSAIIIGEILWKLIKEIIQERKNKKWDSD